LGKPVKRSRPVGERKSFPGPARFRKTAVQKKKGFSSRGRFSDARPSRAAWFRGDAPFRIFSARRGGATLSTPGHFALGRPEARGREQGFLRFFGRGGGRPDLRERRFFRTVSNERLPVFNGNFAGRTGLHPPPADLAGACPPKSKVRGPDGNSTGGQNLRKNVVFREIPGHSGGDERGASNAEDALLAFERPGDQVVRREFVERFVTFPPAKRAPKPTTLFLLPHGGRFQSIRSSVLQWKKSKAIGFFCRRNVNGGVSNSGGLGTAQIVGGTAGEFWGSRGRGFAARGGGPKKTNGARGARGSPRFIAGGIPGGLCRPKGPNVSLRDRAKDNEKKKPRLGSIPPRNKQTREAPESNLPQEGEPGAGSFREKDAEATIWVFLSQPRGSGL